MQWQITEFTKRDIKIALRNPDEPEGRSWAVLRHGGRLSREGGFDCEPLPSSRTDNWIEEHSFTLEEAKEQADKIMCDD